MGPVEVLVISFPGNQFTGEIIPELQRLTDDGVISVVDGLLVRKDGAGEVTYFEFEELGEGDDAAALAAVLDQVESLISDDDVRMLAESLEPNSSEAILVLEHKWARPLRDAIVAANGRLAANFRIPDTSVDELLSELAGMEDST
jgi:uncharacterized membrane protein